MAIKNLRVTNFKTFVDLEVELGKFNVVIGPNASGKSNFVQVFQFLRDMANHGLDNAISMQGGIEYLTNISIGSSRDLLIEFVSDQKGGGFPIGEITFETYETAYRLRMKFEEQGPGFEIAEDKLTSKCKFMRRRNRTKKGKENIGNGEIVISNVAGKIKLDAKLPSGVTRKDLFLPFPPGLEVPPKTPLIRTPFARLFVYPFESFLPDVAIYDFDPKLSKKAVPITGKMELEENGGNLAIVLKNILEDREKERRLSNLVRDLLPFVSKLAVEKFADKSLLFKLEETYAREYLPASLISDGTINITALIVALYFEKKPLTIIEEPERNIHPYLISRVIEMMQEASQEKQILITTHNPEVVRHADLDSILLITRDNNGLSAISRPSEKKEVAAFLESNVTIEELYVEDLLRA
jgi:predicted ATPase